MFVFRFFFIIGYYKIFNLVPCAVQQDSRLFYIEQFVSLILKLLICPFPSLFPLW